MMIIIDDAAGMTKYMWEYLDTVVIGGEMETVETINLFDEYNKLKAENNRLREENYDLTLTFLLSKEKADDEIEKLREALQSISNNTCCDNCQEAALVARAALKEKE